MMHPFPQGMSACGAGSNVSLVSGVWYWNSPPSEEAERAARKVRLKYGEE